MDVQNEERRIKLTNSGLEMGEAIIIGNFGTSGRDVTPYYHHTGTWFDAFTGEAQQVNSTSDTYYLGAGEFKIFTPTKSGTWVNLQYPVNIQHLLAKALMCMRKYLLAAEPIKQDAPKE